MRFTLHIGKKTEIFPRIFIVFLSSTRQILQQFLKEVYYFFILRLIFSVSSYVSCNKSFKLKIFRWINSSSRKNTHYIARVLSFKISNSKCAFISSGLWRRLTSLSTVYFLRSICDLIAKNLDLGCLESLRKNYYGLSKCRQPITK
jgi:hypothetical protein